MEPLPFYCDARQDHRRVVGGWVAYPEPNVRWQGRLALGRLNVNNSTLAEMLVLGASLRALRARGALSERPLAAYLDNLFVVQAMSGAKVRVRSAVAGAFEDAKLAASFFPSATYTWIPRSKNWLADEIASLSDARAMQLHDTVTMNADGRWPPIRKIAITSGDGRWSPTGDVQAEVQEIVIYSPSCAPGTHHFVNWRCNCGATIDGQGRLRARRR